MECLQGSLRRRDLDTQDKPQSSTQVPLQISTSVENNLPPPDQQQKIYSSQAVDGASSYVLLGTALLYLYDHSGKQHECRALLDSCSQRYIITRSLCKRLGLHQTRTNITLLGIEQGNQEVTFKTTAKLKSRVTDFLTSLTCLIVNNSSDNFPSNHVQSAGIQIPDYHTGRPNILSITTSRFAYRSISILSFIMRQTN